MLTRTFVHVPSIGYAVERRLWDAGIGSWEDAVACESRPKGFSASRWSLVRDTVANSCASLQARDHQYFASLLSSRDQWRAFPEFRNRVAYLDIETDGMSAWSKITVIGVYDGQSTHTYVAGDNMDAFAEDIQQYGLLVTFNGASFDLPFLRRRFGPIFDQLHVDLRFALGRLGHHGGLKSIERSLGIRRGDEIADISGDDAVRLWHEYQGGSQEALDLLVTYNRADVENLESLMEMAYRELWDRLVKTGGSE